MALDNYLIVITGPTAIGKTAKSIALAKAFGAEILSADSRQFYREMTIGTAVPSEKELRAVPHHFIHHISIDDPYSVGDFEADALKKLEELFQKHRIVLLVGGSGLYIKAVTEGLDRFPKPLPGLRDDLNRRIETEGIETLQEQLKGLDPEGASKIDLNNPHRIIRVLEVCLSSGKPYSSFLNRNKPKRPFGILKIGLDAPRKILYGRIEKRVDLMIENGLTDEAGQLYEHRSKNALNTVGYKELFAHFDGHCPLKAAIDEIKKNSRRFAKRQLTWFRKDDTIKWFAYDTPAPRIESYIRSEVSEA